MLFKLFRNRKINVYVEFDYYRYICYSDSIDGIVITGVGDDVNSMIDNFISLYNKKFGSVKVKNDFNFLHKKYFLFIIPFLNTRFFCFYYKRRIVKYEIMDGFYHITLKKNHRVKRIKMNRYIIIREVRY